MDIGELSLYQFVVYRRPTKLTRETSIILVYSLTKIGKSTQRYFSYICRFPSISFADFVREKVTDLQNSIDKLYTNVMPKRILIGTHHYVPTEKVYFTSKGIRIFAPNVKNANEMVILDIQTNEVVKIVSHMQNPKCVFFIYTLNSCGAYVRESLDMTSIHDNST